MRCLRCTKDEIISLAPFLNDIFMAIHLGRIERAHEERARIGRLTNSCCMVPTKHHIIIRQATCPCRKTRVYHLTSIQNTHCATWEQRLGTSNLDSFSTCIQKHGEKPAQHKRQTLGKPHDLFLCLVCHDLAQKASSRAGASVNRRLLSSG